MVAGTDAQPMTFSPTCSSDALVASSLWNWSIFPWNCHNASAGSQLASLSGSPFHRTKYSCCGRWYFCLITRSASMFSTSRSYETFTPIGARSDLPRFGSS
ncbi:hypothetical protein V6Z12_D11G391800 [Gossypium hirsutum]